MKTILGAVAGLTLAAAISAAPLQAQDMGSTRAFSLGIAGGATIPTGDASDLWDTGFNVMGTLGFRPAALPIGVRFDVMYHNLGGKSVDFGGIGVDVDDLSVIAGAANAVVNFTTEGGIRPYLIGGVGIYNVDFGDGGGVGGDDSQTKFGLNGGAGLEFALSGFNTFLEARYHSIFTDDENTNLIPIVFGIRF